jgi:hypothetical protein
MERLEIPEMMSTLKLSGMRAAYDEVVTNGSSLLGVDGNGAMRAA